MPTTLESSFEELIEKTLSIARECNDNQDVLQRFLDTHPNQLSVRFRTTHLKGSLTNLIDELLRTCIVSEDNIEMLLEIIPSNNDLRIAYDMHQDRIANKCGLKFTSRYTEVIDLIASKIGVNWSCFGRQLDVPDGEVDEIRDEIKDPRKRIEALFEWLVSKVPQNKQKKRILDALVSSRRKDLAEEVHEALARC